jgi:hypothetical protein
MAVNTGSSCSHCHQPIQEASIDVDQVIQMNRGVPKALIDDEIVHLDWQAWTESCCEMKCQCEDCGSLPN